MNQSVSTELFCFELLIMIKFFFFLIRYKHELHLSSERERSIERSKAQMELDWQVRNIVHTCSVLNTIGT